MHSLLVKTIFFLSISGLTADNVEIESVPCTVLSMSFFDRLYGPVVRDSGYLVKCFDEFYEDFTISDELRKVEVHLYVKNNTCIIYALTTQSWVLMGIRKPSENIVGKREKSGKQRFLIFQQCFVDY